jgi:hypothetical protein
VIGSFYFNVSISSPMFKSLSPHKDSSEATEFSGSSIGLLCSSDSDPSMGWSWFWGDSKEGGSMTNPTVESISGGSSRLLDAT